MSGGAPILATPCRWCGRPVYWLHHERTGKLAPIDVEPALDGNVAIDAAGNRYGIRAAGSAPELRRNHWSTCPEAERHRSAKKRLEVRA